MIGCHPWLGLRAVFITVLIAMGIPAVAQNKPGGVVSIGGSVTEIIYALGAADRLVARDTTSRFPSGAENLPDVGYMRALSPEGVLSVNPSMIIAEEGAGPPETIAVLEGADIPFFIVAQQYSSDGIAKKIVAVGEAIGEPARALALAKQIAIKLEQATAASRRHAGASKRVLFVLSTQGGRMLASGTGTAAAAMIEMSGAQNAVTAFEGYKPMTDEAVIAAAPDVILMMERGGEHDSAVNDLMKLPAVASTPAGVNRAVIRMEGLYLLGFGPRTADAVTDLRTALYGS